MKYSYPEYSSSNNPDNSVHFQGNARDIKPAKSQGIPNYSTSSGASSGQVHKPLVSSFYSDVMGTSFTPFPSNANIPNKPLKPISSMQDNSNPLNNVPIPGTPQPVMPGNQTLPRQTMPGTTSPVIPSRPNATIPAIPSITLPNTPTMPLRPGTVVPTVPTTPGNISTTPFRPGTMTAPITAGTMPNSRSATPTPTIPGTPGNATPITPPTAPITMAPAMPGITMPRATMPGSTMPGTTMPRSTMPGITMPATTTPITTMPGMTMPSTMPGTLPGSMPGTIPPITPTLPGNPPLTTPASNLGKLPRTQNINPNTVGSSKVDYDYSDLGGFGPNGIYMTNITPYHVPLGVPMMPLYGYDNSEDADKDLDYMRQMYPITAKKMLASIEEECDKLEYDGSCMFDEYPDRVYLSRIVDKIYAKCVDLNEASVSSESLSTINRPVSDEVYLQTPTKNSSNKESYVDVNGKNWLRDMTEILLYNEMLNRRRRYRSRKRWF